MDHIIEHNVASFKTIFWISKRIIECSCFQHTHQYSTLFHGQISRSCIKISFACSFDAERIGTEVHCVGIHGQNIFFIVYHFEFQSDNPLLTFHNKHSDTRQFSEQSGRILRAYTEHILGKLLRYSGSTSCIISCNSVLYSCEKALEIDTEVMIEAFVFGIYQCFPEHRVNFSVLYGCSVFIEVFADKFAVGTVYLRCFGSIGMHNLRKARRFTEEP